MSIHAYARDVSVRAGERLELCVSTTAPYYRVEFYRQGADLEPIPSMNTGTVGGWSVPAGLAGEDWGWPICSVTVPRDSRSGAYVACLIEIDNEGNERRPEGDPLNRLEGTALVVVRPASGERAAEILYKVSAATYQAYNEAGGGSFYRRANWWRGLEGEGFKVTLRRTGCGVGSVVMGGEAPDPYHTESRRQTFAHWDAPFIAWLERQGIRCDFCTDFDLDRDDSILIGHNLLLSVGHDEYWSNGMRERVLAFVRGGGNVAFLSGNVANYRVGFADNGAAMYTSKGFPGRQGAVKHETDVWHDIDPADELTGSCPARGGGWWDGFRALDSYIVQEAEHWSFSGMGVTKGDAFGAQPDAPAVGYEVDGVAYREDRGKKIAVDVSGMATEFFILGFASLSEGWVAKHGGACAVMGTMTSPAGGITFHAGSTDWVACVGSDPAIGTITQNVVERLRRPSVRIVGPVGQEEDAALPPCVEEQECRVYVDLGQLGERSAEDGCEFLWSLSGADAVGACNGPVLRLRPRPGEAVVGVSVEVTRGGQIAAFGSKMIVSTSAVDARRIEACAAIRNMAMPTDPVAYLFAPDETPQELVRDVSPSRLHWLANRSGKLQRVVQDLERMWSESGSMAGTTDEPSATAGERFRW